MKISIHNYVDSKHEMINIPNDTEDEEIETELSKLGYSLSNIEYMVIPNDEEEYMNKEKLMDELEHFESDVLQKIKDFKDMTFALNNPKEIHNYEVDDYLLVVNGEIREVSGNTDFDEKDITDKEVLHEDDKATVVQVIEHWT